MSVPRKDAEIQSQPRDARYSRALKQLFLYSTCLFYVFWIVNLSGWIAATRAESNATWWNVQYPVYILLGFAVGGLVMGIVLAVKFSDYYDIRMLHEKRIGYDVEDYHPGTLRRLGRQGEKGAEESAQRSDNIVKHALEQLRERSSSKHSSHG